MWSNVYVKERFEKEMKKHDQEDTQVQDDLKEE